MSNGQTFTLWQINIEPSSFPLAGDCQLAQIPASYFPLSGWFFVFACLGTPSDSQFSTQIGTESYTFNTVNRDANKASGTVTTQSSDSGTWSAQGTSGPSL